MSETFRYAAFISYSSKDAAFAQKLHRALESYGIPSALGKFDLLEGAGKRNRIYPVFRDREELAAGDLSERIEASLKASRALIVVCTANAAASPWVEKEIQSFVALGRRDRIFAIISENAPLFGDDGADATPSCFPPAFRGNALVDARALEPLAADSRKSKDGFRNAWLKIVAGLIGVTPGQLIDRDRRRRSQQRMMAAAAAAAVVAAVAIPIAWQDTAQWREKLTRRADQLRGQGDQTRALPLALAGMDLGGAVMPPRAKDAAAMVRDLAGLTLLTRVNAEGDVAFSDNGKVMQTFAKDGTVTLVDLDGKVAPRVIGKVELALDGPQIRGSFSGKVPPDREGWAIPYALDAEIIRVPAGLNQKSWRIQAARTEVKNPKDAMQRLAGILPGLDIGDLTKDFSHAELTTVWVKSGATTREKEAVDALGIAGISFEDDTQADYPKSGVLEKKTWQAFPDIDGALHLFERGGDHTHRVMKLAEPIAGMWFGRDRALLQTRSGALYAVDRIDGEPTRLGTFAPITGIRSQYLDAMLVVTSAGDLVFAMLGGEAEPAKAQALGRIDLQAEVRDDESNQHEVVRMADGEYLAIDLTGQIPPRRLGKYRKARFEFFGADYDILIGLDESSRNLLHFDFKAGTGGPFATLPPGYEYGVPGNETSVVFGAYDSETQESGTLTWFSLLGRRVTPRGGIGEAMAETLDGRLAAGWVRKSGKLTLYEGATGKAVAQGRISDMVSMEFYGDALLYWEKSGAMNRFDFASGKPVKIGETAPDKIGSCGCMASSTDDNWFAVQDQSGAYTVYDAKRMSEGKRFEAQAGGAVIALPEGKSTVETIAADGSVSIHDLADGSTRAGERQPAPAVIYSNDTAHRRAGQDSAGKLAVYEGYPAKLVADLGELPPMNRLVLTPAGKTLAAEQKDGVLLVFDLEAPGKPHNLSQEFPNVPYQVGKDQYSSAPFELAGDGKALVLRGPKSELSLINLRGKPAAISLGLQSNGIRYRFVGSGHRIMFGKYGEEMAVYDLASSAEIATLDGSALASRVCRQSADQLQPFDANLREEKANRPPDDQAVYDALKGRPWNPCDWRGVLAILPDDSGGGWFEGPRQWMRLAGVRMGIAKDYTCEETLSAADVARQELRRAACMTARPSTAEVAR